MKKLPKAVTQARDSLAIELDQAISEGQAHFEERSDKWQDSENGHTYQEWLEALQNFRDQLDELPETPGA